MELFYEEMGSGEVLILLHGNGESHEYFKGQMGFFSRYYRTIAIDTRGHGRSPRGDGEFSISRFADDLYDFMKRRGIEQANLLGFSDGGNIALVFAIRYPDRVKRLVLNGANLYAAGVKAHVQVPITIGYHVASLFAGKSPRAKANAEMLGLMVNDPNLTVEELKKVTCPTLVIAGTKDMIKASHTRLIHQGIKNSRLVFLEGDHFIAGKHPEAFNQAVGSFLSQS